jgi:hypothetical protein
MHAIIGMMLEVHGKGWHVSFTTLFNYDLHQDIMTKTRAILTTWFTDKLVPAFEAAKASSSSTWRQDMLDDHILM